MLIVQPTTTPGSVVSDLTAILAEVTTANQLTVALLNRWAEEPGQQRVVAGALNTQNIHTTNTLSLGGTSVENLTLYTVPANKLFFCEALSLSTHAESGGVPGNYLSLFRVAPSGPGTGSHYQIDRDIPMNVRQNDHEDLAGGWYVAGQIFSLSGLRNANSISVFLRGMVKGFEVDLV